MNDTTFTSYDIETSENSSLQFKLMDMNDFFPHFGHVLQEPHLHNFYQILWFRSGKGVHYVDFKEYPVEPDTLFFITKGQLHYFDSGTDYQGVVIHFNESFLADEDSSENVFLKYNIFNAFDAVPYYKVKDAVTAKLQWITKEMQEEAGNENLFAHSDCLKYLLKLFLILIQRDGQRGSGEPLCPNNAMNRNFVKFRQLLEHHFRDMHTVQEYSEALNVSSKTLTTSVKASAHSTPLALINDRLVLEAKRLLKFSSMKVKEIAYYLGFEDPSYFIKFFKRRTGQLPAEFREE